MKKKVIIFAAVLTIALIIVLGISKLSDHSVTQQPVASDTEDASNNHDTDLTEKDNNDTEIIEEDSSPDELPIIPAASGEDDSDLTEQAEEEQTDELSDAEESPVDDEDIQSSEPIPQQGVELGDNELPILP